MHCCIDIHALLHRHPCNTYGSYGFGMPASVRHKHVEFLQLRERPWVRIKICPLCLLQVLRLHPAIPVTPREAAADDILPSGDRVLAGLPAPKLSEVC